MSKDVSELFESYFGKLNDPRIDRKKLYPLVEVLFVVLCGSICGAESWRDFVLFGKSKLDFLRQYYEFKNGIPSKNTFSRVFSALDAEAFKLQFVEWVKSLQTILNEVIAIDGKTLCNSIDKAMGSSAIHMVSAFATGARLVLAQQKVDEKSNEITAIPKLLDLLDLKGHIVTIDAMGTQKAIAKQIIDQGGDYILALKGNQGTLNEEVRLFLETELKKTSSIAIQDRCEDVDKRHGRIETRKCFVSAEGLITDELSQTQSFINQREHGTKESYGEVVYYSQIKQWRTINLIYNSLTALYPSESNLISSDSVFNPSAALEETSQQVKLSLSDKTSSEELRLAMSPFSFFGQTKQNINPNQEVTNQSIPEC